MEIKKEQSIELLCSLKNELCDKKFVLYGVQTKENFINIFNSITDV